MKSNRGLVEDDRFHCFHDAVGDFQTEVDGEESFVDGDAGAVANTAFVGVWHLAYCG